MKYISKSVTVAVKKQKKGKIIELWHVIDGFPDYEISIEGFVRKLSSKTVLKPKTEKNRNEERVTLYRQNSQFIVNISKLVMETFVLEKKNCRIIHIDNDFTNNRLFNLDYENDICTSSDKFVAINDFPDYMINQEGKVFSTKTRRFLKPRLSNTGHLFVSLTKNGTKKECFIHKLVAKTFIQNPDHFDCVNHIDGNKLNNHVSNLEWCTIRENNIHSYENGLRGVPRKTKLRESDIPWIKKMAAVGIPNSKIAEVYDVCPSSISRIVRGENWKNI